MLAELDVEEEWYRRALSRSLRFAYSSTRCIHFRCLRYFDASASPPLLYLYYNGTTPPPADFELVAVMLQVPAYTVQ